MSLYSGKCDVYDHYLMIGVDDKTTEDDINERIAKSRFYICTRDNKRHKLDIKNIHDLVPYFPYLVIIGGFSKENGDNVTLSSRSFVDSEEDKLITTYINDVVAYAKKCKRNHEEFTKENAVKDIFGSQEIISGIAEVVLDKGLKITLSDVYEKNIHLSISEYYRNRLYETMISFGYSEMDAYCWCFNEFFVNKDSMTRLRKD